METKEKRFSTKGGSRDFSGSVVVFFILLFVYSKWGPAIPFNFTTQNKGEPLIVSAEGKVVTVPDIAKVSVGIQETGQTLKQVQDNANKKSQSLVTALKSLEIDEKDIKTTSYNVYPQYDYTNPSSRITGYQVSINYEVTVKDIDKVNDVLSQVTNSGANLVGGVTFAISDEVKKDKLNEAREKASNEAKEKAKGLAKAAGITLGKIINVSESEGFDYPRPMPMMEKAVDMGGIEPVTAEVTPGETELAVTVTLSYEIR